MILDSSDENNSKFILESLIESVFYVMQKERERERERERNRKIKTHQIGDQDWQVDDVEVEDHSVVAQEAPGLAKLRQLVALCQLPRKELHQDGHSDDSCRDAPGPECIPDGEKPNILVRLG